jgi:hypothetical protein
MERNDIHAQITTLAGKIRHLNELLANESSLHPVELELMHWYAREIKSRIEQLAAFKSDPEAENGEAQAAPAPVAAAPAEPVDEPVVEPPAVAEAEEKTEAVLDDENETAGHMAVQVVEEITVTKETTIARKAGNEKKSVSLNEKLKKDFTVLSDKLKTTKKKNIKELFEVNERYKFIEELFGGSAEQFNKALNDLGKIKSRSEAERCIDNIRSKYGWEKKQALAERFTGQVIGFLE